MRINEIISEDMDVNEARPMGILNRIGQTALSMTPTNIGKKAKGTIETGKKANELMNQYMQWLGKNHYEENKESLLNFLKQIGLPNDAVQAASKVLDSSQVQPSSTQSSQSVAPASPSTTQQATSQAPAQQNTTPQPNPVSEADGNQSIKLDSKLISQAIMAAVVQQVRSGQPINNFGGNQQKPIASPTSPTVSGGGANTASSNNTVDQMGTTADSTQTTSPASKPAKQSAIQKPTGPQPNQKVTFPGTTPPVVFKYNPQWVDSKGNPASEDVVTVLNQLAIGQEVSQVALQKARNVLLPSATNENKIAKQQSIVEFHSNFLGKTI